MVPNSQRQSPRYHPCDSPLACSRLPVVFPSTDIEHHGCMARDRMLSRQPSPLHGALQLRTPSRLPVLAGHQ